MSGEIKRRPLRVKECKVQSEWAAHWPDSWVEYWMEMDCGHCQLASWPAPRGIPTASNLGNHRYACGVCMAEALRTDPNYAEPMASGAAGENSQATAGSKAVSSRPSELREALEQIAAVENTRTRCVRHGGEAGADDPGTCWCSVSLDAGEKAKAIARAALATEGEQ